MIQLKPQLKKTGDIPTGEVDYNQVHDECFVDIELELKPQPIAISIGESEWKGKHYPIAFGSYGDFSCIVGASKSKKTFLKSMLAACYIGGNANNFADTIKGFQTIGKYVIDIDTEQSQFHAQRVFRRVIEMVGSNTKFYVTFALRPKSPKQRLDFIDWLFTKSKYAGKIGLCLIDGIADLVSDINDLEASNNVTQKLMTWSAGTSEETQCHIITVLHRNFGSAKPTGHLGSSVLKKAETVVFVEKENDTVMVKPEYTRNQPFEPFAFEVVDHLPVVIQDFDMSYSIEDKSTKQSKAKF